jgi:hypothetical protein
MGDHDEYCYEDDYIFHDFENRPADYDSEIESQLDEDDEDDWDDEDDDDIDCEYYDSFHEDFHSDEAVGQVDYYDNPYND